MAPERSMLAAKLALFPTLAAASYVPDPVGYDSARLWAEEGTNYLHSALAHERGLVHLAAAQHAPYLNVIPQASTWVAAHATPLEWAPLVTMATWLAVVSVVVAVCLLGRAELLSS